MYEVNAMREKVRAMWTELDLIKDNQLRDKVLDTWVLALEQSPLTIEDLYNIPFTLLIKDCKVSFISHKRAVVHIAYESAKLMIEFFGENLPIDLDVVVSGAILADVGKMLEYERIDGKIVVSKTGRYLRHPFTGVSLARSCGIPDEICHIIAAHAKEGDLVIRSTEAFIVHYADFMSFLPFKNAYNTC